MTCGIQLVCYTRVCQILIFVQQGLVKTVRHVGNYWFKNCWLTKMEISATTMDCSIKNKDEHKILNSTPVGSNLGQFSWNLADKMSFLPKTKDSANELTRLQSHPINEEEKAILIHDDGKIEHWIRKLDSFHVHSLISQRLFVVTASSATRERDFCILKGTMGAERSKLKNDIIDALLYVRWEEDSNQRGNGNAYSSYCK